MSAHFVFAFLLVASPLSGQRTEEVKGERAESEREYSVGFKWKRGEDYEDGRNGKNGNPSRDKLGNPVWKFESVRPKATDWYLQEARKMTFHPLYGSGAGGWVSNSCGIERLGLDVDARKTPSDIPVARWMNPTGREVAISIDGDVLLSSLKETTSAKLLGRVEFSILHYKQASKSYDLLVKANSRDDVAVKVIVQPKDEIVFAAYHPAMFRKSPGVSFSIRDRLVLTLESIPKGIEKGRAQREVKQPSPLESPGRGSSEQLEGTWILISTRGMRKNSKRLQQTFNFQDGHWALTTGNRVTQAGSFAIVESTERYAAFDLKLSRGGRTTIRAIFEIEDDTLRYCGTWLDSRPKDFNTAPGDGEFFSVWKRAEGLPGFDVPSDVIQEYWRKVLGDPVK